jgi:hypothetical protein
VSSSGWLSAARWPPGTVEPLDATAVVLVNPMVPQPDETPGAWWGSTGDQGCGEGPERCRDDDLARRTGRVKPRDLARQERETRSGS